MAKQSPLVSVVVLNHNGAGIAQVIRRGVEALVRQSYPYLELIMVDDCSTDGSDELLRALCEEFGGVFASTKEKRRHGVSAARNVGLDIARGEYIAFLDNDAYPERDWLAKLVERMEKEPSVGACASRVVFADKPDIINSVGSVLNELFHGNGVCIHEMYAFAQVPDEIMYATGNGMMLRREAIAQVGPFDEGFLFWGADDADYGMRLRRAGWKIVSVPDALVYHLHSYSKKEQGMPFWDGRNRIRMALKHLSWRELGSFLFQDVRYYARPRLLKDYGRYWLSTLGDWAGLRELLVYRWRHRGEPAYRQAFAKFFAPERRLIIAPDNRAFGRQLLPLERVWVGEKEEDYLYHGWYWRESWGQTPMRWAMPVASLVGSLPRGALALRWWLLAHPRLERISLTLLVKGVRDDKEVGRWRLQLGDSGPIVPFYDVECHLPPGEYRFVFLAEKGYLEEGVFPRRIGFGLAGLEVLH
ncbi:MAG: glycosyltransferase family 2 protein [Anaerolineae bacterium]|nr:glycosyltransferase family 2 protein [Anaerolineae bacterium]